MSMEFYDRRTPISRKERACEMCGQKIMPGERYIYESGKFDGEFFTRSLHTECFNVLSDFCEEVNNEFSWGEIAWWWRDTRCDKCKHYYPPCDLMCKFHKDVPESCGDYRNGRCTSDEPCFEMNRVCWCDKFEEE